MKTKEFTKVIEKASKALPKKAIQPVLDNVLIRACNTSFEISTTNLNIHYTNNIHRYSDGSDFEITVPCKPLLNLLKNIKSSFVKLSIDNEGMALLVETESNTYKLKGINAFEFPPLPVEENSKFIFSVPSQAFKNLAIFTTNLNNKNVLDFINYRPSTGKLASCNGSLILEYQTYINPEIIYDIFIRPEISKCLEGNYDVFCNNEKGLMFQNSDNLNEKIYMRALDETRYPQYEYLIPQHNVTLFEANTKDILKVLKDIKTTLNTRTNITKINWSNNNIEFSTETPELGKTTSILEAKAININTIKYKNIYVNYHYLKTLLGVSESIIFRIDPKTNLASITLRYDNKKYSGLLMPIQIK
jgi:DNA polymerase III sliding clamp (beta) subunit (PCNA family)